MNINRIPKRIRALVPYKIKRLFVRLYVRYALIGCPGKADKPRISFAEILPKEGEFIRGGKVKLTYLRKKFGEYKKKFNILYLVSSTLPGFADIWVDEAKRKGVKIVWNQNGVGNPSWTDDWKKVNDTMKPIINADHVIYQSEFCKVECDDLVFKYGGPHSIIYNCVDTDSSKPANPRLPLEPIRLLVTGTAMTSEKIFLPLEATRILLNKGVNVKLSIHGPAEWPNAKEETENKINSLNLEDFVEQHGKYKRDESAGIYQSGHIYLHLKYMDPSPNTVLSAMSAGLPVIASKSGGTAEIIDQKAGILLEVPLSRQKLHYPSPESVADAIEKISKDYINFSNNARECAIKNFSVLEWTKNHEEIFTNVLRN